MSNLDLVLVNPGNRTRVYGKLASSLAGIEPPIWAGLLAAFVRENGYSVTIIDAEAEGTTPEDVADLVADCNPLLTVMVVSGSNPSASSTPKMPVASLTAQEIKKKSSDNRIIFYGLHPSALPERTLQEEETDFVCKGEGFQTMLQLVKALKAGGVPDYSRIPGLYYRQNGDIMSSGPAPLVNPDDLPLAAWDLLPMELYRAHNWHCFDNLEHRNSYAALYTSLGCPFNCNYCNIRAMYSGKPGLRNRTPERVVEEIDLLVNKYGVSKIKFIDELFTINEERVTHLCDLLIKRDYCLNIWAYGRVDTVKQAMLVKMKQAGINWVAYGFESANQEVRQGMDKKFRQDAVRNAVDMTHAAGINIMGNFIFGLPGDNLETMKETLDLAKALRCEYVNFYTAMAYPGSQLYDDAIRQGIRLPDTWNGYGQYGEDTLPLPTKHVTATEVLRFRDYAFNDYFSDPTYLALIQEKFGQKAVNHIETMLQHKIKRKYT
ncbi:B12-binding domain-containing radical SAM protein [Chloroflexota bacterium]